ncbi:MAG: prephenate/arogenate dehydrogenase family protein [Pseudomonadota bacterium]
MAEPQPKTRQADFQRVALIGVGLIGGSLSLGLQNAGVVGDIIGFDRDEKALSRAIELGLIDEAAPSLGDAVADASLIILATPVGATAQMLGDVGKAAPPEAIIIDVGSVKSSLVEAAASLGSGRYFVPCHPVSGTEQSGPDAAFATLFRDRWCIVTPVPDPSTEYQTAVEKVVALWRSVGANVEIMDAAHHDLALAVTSHLPHLIAFTLVGAADDLESVAEADIIKYSAGGFRDFTRIAASDPVMWRDVFLNNKDAILEVLGRFSEELALLQRAIRWGDGPALEKTFARGRALRRAIVDAGQETPAPNFGRDQTKTPPD